MRLGRWVSARQRPAPVSPGHREGRRGGGLRGCAWEMEAPRCPGSQARPTPLPTADLHLHPRLTWPLEGGARVGFISCGVRMWPDQKPTDANSRLTKVSRDRGLAGRGGEVEVGRSDPFRPLQEAPLHPWPKAALCKPTRPRVPRPGGRSGLAALLPPRRTRRPRDRPWRLGWAWGSVRAPRRSSPWRVHPRSHSLHCTCWWLLGPGPLEGRSPTKQFPLLPSPPCFGGSFPSSPGEHKSGGSALASVVSFCRGVWACLPAVVAAAFFRCGPRALPPPQVAQCLCRGQARSHAPSEETPSRTLLAPCSDTCPFSVSALLDKILGEIYRKVRSLLMFSDLGEGRRANAS